MHYGTRNIEYVGGWRALENDGPMWALNLMRYRPRAIYADGRETTLTGMEADDLYAPHEALAKIGGRSVLRARVAHQVVGDGGRWDRVAVAYYPTRCSQLDMQQLDSFKRQHPHKVAGMEFTIVVASMPDPAVPPNTEAPADRSHMLLQVVSDRAAPDLAQGLEATRIAVFDVENVIIGDERRYAQARWDWISEATAEALAARPRRDDPTDYVLVLAPERSAFLQSLIDPSAIPPIPED